MTMTAKRPSKKNVEKTGKEKALKIAGQDDYLGGQTKSTRFDLDYRIKKALSLLGTVSETDEGGKVYERALVTEALLDLFEKYENGNGQYTLTDKFKFNKK